MSTLHRLQQYRHEAAGQFSPGICEAIQHRIAELLRDRAKQFKIIAKREADYWSACPGY